MKKILITGSTGMLGSDLVRTFREFGQYDIYGLSRTTNPLIPQGNQFSIDLTQLGDVDKISITPDVIIHTAALTDLNLCEHDPQLADSVHVQASRALAKIAGRQTRFIYISTDSVFDGKKGDYSESDIPNPLNVYARSKLMGEQAVIEANKGLTTIIRTNIYGFHLPMKNSLAEWAYREWTAGKIISGFSDTFFNAVFTHQLAGIIRFMIDQQVTYPILNIGSDTTISKYDFLEKFRIKLGIDNTLLKPAKSADFPSIVQRPRDTSLNTSLLAGFYKVPDFDHGLQDWVTQASAHGLFQAHA